MELNPYPTNGFPSRTTSLSRAFLVLGRAGEFDLDGATGALFTAQSGGMRRRFAAVQLVANGADDDDYFTECTSAVEHV